MHTCFKYSQTTRQETQFRFIKNVTAGAMLDLLLPRSQTLSKLASERLRGLLTVRKRLYLQKKISNISEGTEERLWLSKILDILQI